MATAAVEGSADEVGARVTREGVRCTWNRAFACSRRVRRTGSRTPSVHGTNESERGARQLLVTHRTPVCDPKTPIPRGLRRFAGGGRMPAGRSAMMQATGMAEPQSRSAG